MFDTTTTANNIAHWADLGVQLPKSVTDAVAVFEAATYIQGPSTHIDTDGITAANAEAVVSELAAALAAEAQFNEAQGRVRRALAREVLRAAGAAVPELIQAIRPKFDAAVAEFREAVALLPVPVTSDALIEAGPAALAAYQAAADAAGRIAAVDHWLAGLSALPAYAGFNPEPALRVLNPTTRGELQTLITSDGTEQRLPQRYLVAVREDIAFGMNTPREAAAIRQEIDAQPIERRRVRTRF